MSNEIKYNPHEDKALKILGKINGTSKASEILKEIKETAHEKVEKVLAYGWKVLVIGILLSVFQQVVGINVVLYYAPTIFKGLGFGNDAAMLSGILAAKAVMKAVENGSADYLDEYKQLTKNIRNEVKAAYRLQQLFYSRFFYKQIFRSLAKHKNFGLFYIDEVMSTYHYRYRNFIFQYFLKERRKRTN